MGVKFAFYKGSGSLFDKAIRLWTRGPYAHVEAILEENADGTYTIASSVPGTGVRIATNQTLAESDWDIVEGPGDVAAVREWFEARVGASYDYLGLFHFILQPAEVQSKNKYFCSEACLLSIGYDEAWREYPNSMFNLIAFAGRLAAAPV